MTHSARYDTQRIPENRRGTKTNRAYIKYSIGCEEERRPGAKAAAFASTRIQKKAYKLAETSNLRAEQVQGRVLRACYRNAMADYGEWVDSKIYGGP